MLDSSDLQNGRLNDVTSHWYNELLLGQDVTLSLGMKEPRWVNMVVLYFNAYDAKHVTPHFDILASDLEAKTDRLVASVRHNGQVYAHRQVRAGQDVAGQGGLVNAIARLRTITEIEVYGPLSGKEGVPGFDDPDGQNTYMGDFTRVDKRVMKLPASFKPPVVTPGQTPTTATGMCRCAAARCPQQLLHRPRDGQSTAHTLAEPLKETYRTRANGMGFAPHGTLYGGLILTAASTASSTACIPTAARCCGRQRRAIGCSAVRSQSARTCSCRARRTSTRSIWPAAASSR